MINSISEITQLWDKALRKIEEQIGEKQVFDSFFSTSYIYEISGNTVVVAVKSPLGVALMQTKYNELIKSVVDEITGSNFAIQYVEESKAQQKEAQSGAVQEDKNPRYFRDAVIDPNQTFDSFVVGQFNREASHASLIVASNPGKMYNPLFIFSHSGLGKTHLLHAIGNYIIKEKMPGARILYITANNFVEEFVKFVRGEKESQSLKDFFKNVDVLLLDDVQFLANRTQTQEMFFYIYNDLVNRGKQIVITSDRQPNELNKLEERLVTRFTQGLVVSIQEPDQNTCVEILKSKIAAKGLNVDNFDENVLYFLADKFNKNVRELDGALDRLIFVADMEGKGDKVTMEVALNAMSSISGGKQLSSQISEQKIINVVADYYNLAPSELTGKNRSGQIALARHIAMYLIRNTLDIPLKKIGDMFGGKDHTTVMSGISKVDKELKTDKSLKEAVDELQKRIKV